MLPKTKKSRKDEQLFGTIQWMLMYSFHFSKEDEYNKWYRIEKKSLYKTSSKDRIDHIEQNVLDSTSYNQFLKSYGVDCRISR